MGKETLKTPTPTQIHKNFLYVHIYLKEQRLQCRLRAGPIPKRQRSRLQPSSSQGALELAYANGRFALKTDLRNEGQQLSTAKPPVWEHVARRPEWGLAQEKTLKLQPYHYTNLF